MLQYPYNEASEHTAVCLLFKPMYICACSVSKKISSRDYVITFTEDSQYIVRVASYTGSHCFFNGVETQE